MKKVLVIQTAFIGDAILATATAVSIKRSFPDCEVDFLVRKGNEALVSLCPSVDRVLIFDKKKNKVLEFIRLYKLLGKTEYCYIFNLHRFFSSGFITFFLRSKIKVGYQQNPLSKYYHYKVSFSAEKGLHEIQRNHQLLTQVHPFPLQKPLLVLDEAHFNKVAVYSTSAYVTLAPASVWFTKQFPLQKWVELTELIDKSYSIFIIGAPNDYRLAQSIIEQSKNKNITNLCGKLSLPESGALMSKAKMNFANDSGPVHLATALNAPITEIFCSTLPDFGFTPLSEKSYVVETKEKLNCRPCGLHGLKSCPEKHFKCGNTIDVQEMLSRVGLV